MSTDHVRPKTGPCFNEILNFRSLCCLNAIDWTKNIYVSMLQATYIHAYTPLHVL